MIFSKNLHQLSIHFLNFLPRPEWEKDACDLEGALVEATHIGLELVYKVITLLLVLGKETSM